MEHQVEVFYITGQHGKTDDTRHELAKFFEPEHAATHLTTHFGSGSGWHDVKVDMRVETWVLQHVAHRPG
jgi:hypothetical protein